MGEFSFRNDLSNLMRDCDLQLLLDFIGHDYDFEADTPTLSRTWLSPVKCACQ